MDNARPLAAISDDELLRGLVDILRDSRRAESDLIAHIAEVEWRRLYAREASPSMFVYCTQVLRLSEAEAYARITVARASREHPILLDMLADGRLHLTGIARLAPHLTPENRAELLERATHRSRRQIEELIAEIAPRPDVLALMRRLPVRKEPAAPAAPVGGDREAALACPQLCPDRVERGALTLTRDQDGGLASADPAPGEAGAIRQAATSVQASAAVPSPVVVWRPLVAPSPAVVHTRAPADIQPLGRARYKVQFTASAELHHKLERLRALMRSQVKDGDLAAIIEVAVTEKLERLESRRFAKTTRPRKGLSESRTSPGSRHVPAAVRRAVYERDGGRCRYVDQAGRRCPKRDRLEYHHRHPFGMGGDHGLNNISLMCAAHNAYMAEHDYGREATARGWRSQGLAPGERLPASTPRRVAPPGASP